MDKTLYSNHRSSFKAPSFTVTVTPENYFIYVPADNHLIIKSSGS